MLSVFSKKDKLPAGGYFPFSTDMHSHILPGIDDGAPNVETSLELITGLMAVGVKKSIATPHIISDMYPNNSITIGKALSTLQSALQEKNIPFEVHAAAEYMLDGSFFDLLDMGEKLLTVKDNTILTEFPFATFPNYIEKISFEIITGGYQPILAHPERYGYAHTNYKFFHRWAELGFLLQVNLLSLVGYYGKEVMKAARYIVKNNLCVYLGTDMHHQKHLEALVHKNSQDVYFEYLKDKDWNTLL